MLNKDLLKTWKPRIKDMGVNMGYLAQRAGISPSYLSEIIHGKKDPKAVNTVDRIELIVRELEDEYRVIHAPNN